MKTRLSLLWVFACLSLALYAQIPSGYYKSADGKKASALKTSLHEIISSHKVVSYGDLWEAYETTDVVDGTDDQVYDMFSYDVNYYSSRGNAINREHVVPKSWWGGTSSYASYSDLFNVIPSNATANSAKSNYPLGVIDGNVNFDNGCTRVGKSSQSGGASNVFEPADQYKGDFARIYMYVATCYQNISWLEKYDYAFAAGATDYPTLQPWITKILLDWNRRDPVSEREIKRQEAVYSIQKNRNPFIDYPVLAEHIWGDSTSVAFNLATATPNTGVLPDDGEGTVPDDNNGTQYPDNGEGDGGDKPDEPSTDDPTGGYPVDTEKGTLLFVENFDDVTVGNDNTTSGSSTVWNGNANIASASTVYSAGGAVRVGKSKGAGTLVSVPISFAGGAFVVEIDVKGWTTVEGHLIVTASGCESQTAEYSAVMSDSYETLSLTFEGVSPSPTLTIETSAKRCFITAIRIYQPAEPNSVRDVLSNNDSDEAYYTLSGQRLIGKPLQSGIYIHKGRKILVR